MSATKHELEEQELEKIAWTRDWEQYDFDGSILFRSSSEEDEDNDLEREQMRAENHILRSRSDEVVYTFTINDQPYGSRHWGIMIAKNFEEAKKLLLTLPAQK